MRRLAALHTIRPATLSAVVLPATLPALLSAVILPATLPAVILPATLGFLRAYREKVGVFGGAYNLEIGFLRGFC